MRSAFALRIISGKIIFISRLSRPAGRSKRIFTGGVVAENGRCSAAFCESAALRDTPSVCSLRSQPPSPRGRLLAVAGKFLIAPKTLATGLTACALSVTFGDSSPKGRAKSTAGSFIVSPNTLAIKLTAWLSLRGKTSPAPGEDVTAGDKKGNLARERLRGFSPGGGAVAQRLRGYGWRSEKSVKAIAPTGAALAFLCFDFFFRIVKGE